MLRLLFALGVLTPLVHAAPGYRGGTFPVSPTTYSMWLAGGAGTSTAQPLVVVYFNGPTDWHRHGWAGTFSRLQPYAAVTYRQVAGADTLEVSISADGKRVWVQGQEFSLATTNVFIVRRADDPLRQRVEREGRLPLPTGATEPLSVVLLRDHPNLKARLE